MMNDLLMNVMMLDFAVQDAALFIDTQPNDEEAMRYFHEASTRLNEAKREYRRQGNSLNNREVNAYRNGYICAPWPWVGDESCGCMKNDCNIQ